MWLAAILEFNIQIGVGNAYGVSDVVGIMPGYIRAVEERNKLVVRRVGFFE